MKTKKPWKNFSHFLLHSMDVIFPSGIQLIRGKITVRKCLIFFLGMASLINITIAVHFMIHNHYGSFNGENIEQIKWLLSDFPGDIRLKIEAPDSITVIAEVHPQKIITTLPSPIISSNTLIYSQPHFWYYFFAYLIIYLSCAVSSIINIRRTQNQETKAVPPGK